MIAKKKIRPKRPSDTNPSTARILQVLGVFTDAELALGFGEIKRRLGIAPTTLQRILFSLEESGYLAREPGISRRYQLGYALVERARLAQNAVRIREIAEADIFELARTTNSNATLAILQNNRCYVALRANAPLLPDPSVLVGKSYEMNSSATGRVLLAWSEIDTIDSVLKAENFLSYTSKGKAKADYIELLQMIRSSGYAIDRGEHRPEISAIAAPVFGHGGALLAAVGITRFRERLTRDDEAFLIGTIKEFAYRISSRAGNG